MPVVRASSTISSITQKARIKPSVQSVREPSVIQEMGDTDFGTLDSDKDGYVVSYDSATDKFILISADELLGVAVEDSDLSDAFITQIEQEIDLGQVATTSIDGGSF